jgi:shikimate kinase
MSAQEGEPEDGTGPAAAPSGERRLERTVALVGMMGVGKSTVGRKLAESLATPFVDSDEEIEKAAGLTVQEIFDLHGEPEFRRGERRVIERLLNGPPIVLATGGGAFMNDETRAAIGESGVSVWLKAELGLLVRRVGKRGNRPLLKAGDPETVLQNLMTARHPTYALADITVESRDVPHEVIVNEIIDSLARHLTASTEVAR